MSYLTKLKSEKEASLRYEEETTALKNAILLINNLYIEKDGAFLQDLTKFLQKWQKD